MKRLVIGLLVIGAALAAGAAPAATPGITVRNSVVLTRADGAVVPVAQEFRVRCGRWARDVPTPSVHVIAGDGRTSAWHLAAVVADVRRRPVVRFPHRFIFDKPTRAQISGGEGRNEFNSDQEESSGRVTFTKVHCGKKRTDIRFRVDAVIGSEFFDGTSVTMRGSFSARG